MVVEIRMHIDPKPREKFVKIMSAYRDSQGPLSQANKASFRIREITTRLQR